MWKIHHSFSFSAFIFFHSSWQWCICKRIMQVILPWVMDPDFHFPDCLLSAVTNALQKFSLYPRAFWLMCFWAKVPIITEFFIQLFWFLSLFRTLNAGFCSSTFVVTGFFIGMCFFCEIFFFFTIVWNLENSKLLSKQMISWLFHS